MTNFALQRRMLIFALLNLWTAPKWKKKLTSMKWRIHISRNHRTITSRARNCWTTRTIHIESSYTDLNSNRKKKKLFIKLRSVVVFFVRIFFYHTAIKLLLTELRPRDVLKCSITSQFDFFAGVYTGGGEMCGGGMGTSIDIWAVRVCRNDADRRVIPDFRVTKSCNTPEIMLINWMKNILCKREWFFTSRFLCIPRRDNLLLHSFRWLSDENDRHMGWFDADDADAISVQRKKKFFFFLYKKKTLSVYQYVVSRIHWMWWKCISFREKINICLCGNGQNYFCSVDNRQYKLPTKR